MAPPTFVAAGAGFFLDAVDDPTLTPGYPTGLQANDLLIVQVCLRDDVSNVAVATPSGWTELFPEEGVAGGPMQTILAKFATGSESGTLTITTTTTGGTAGAAHMVAIHGVALSDYTEAASFGVDTANPINAQAVTTVGADRLAIACIFMIQDNATQTWSAFSGESGGDWVQPSGSLYSAFTTVAGITLDVQLADLAAAGTISGGSTTASVQCYGGVRAFALKPIPINLSIMGGLTGGFGQLTGGIR